MIGKEILIILRKYEKLQMRIFDDACDFGVLATEQVKKDIHRAVEELRSLDDHYSSTKEDYSTGFTWKCQGNLRIETSEEYIGKYNGYTFRVEYIESKQPLRSHKENAYFYIEVQYNTQLPD